MTWRDSPATRTLRDGAQECVVRIFDARRARRLRADTAAPGLPSDLVYRIVLAGLDAALSGGVRQTVVVVDSSGEPLAAGSVPGAQPRSERIAAAKAFTACTLGLDTDRFRPDTLAQDDNESATLEAVIAGGVPIWDHATLLGGIGVSGADAAADHTTATAARAAFLNSIHFTTKEI